MAVPINKGCPHQFDVAMAWAGAQLLLLYYGLWVGTKLNNENINCETIAISTFKSAEIYIQAI